MRRPNVIRTPSGETLVERFSIGRRLEHTVVTVSFILLIVTGLPQKFDDSAVGHWLLLLFGGLDGARLVHRITGVVFCLHAVVHLAIIAVGVMMKRMELSLLPTPQDVWDAWNNLRFYLGQRAHPPAMPKFDYRQKFEYMGMVLGGLVMVVSGLVLLFPVEVSAWLPGQLILAFKVMHSSEAVLALSVLVVWHVYGSHLSPDVFPLDKSIFTGYMRAEDLKHHHALEYRRVFGDEGHEPEAAPSDESTGGAGPEPRALEAAPGRSS